MALSTSAPVQKAVWKGRGETPCAQLLAGWKTDLEGLKTSLATIDGIASSKDRFVSGWLAMPATLSRSLAGVLARIEVKPDQTAILDAQTFLSTAQLRLHDYREARGNASAEIASAAAKVAYETYCRVLEDEMNSLYEDVEKDFSTYYRLINGDDEAKFTAKLKPTEGRLDLDVNFYERGLFPPGAHYSEVASGRNGSMFLFPRLAALLATNLHLHCSTMW